MSQSEIPTEYPLKVLGINSPTFSKEIREIVQSEAEIIASKSVESGKGRYLSITFTLHAPNEEAIQHLFKKLTALSTVKLVL